MVMIRPKPLQAAQAPWGWLNEKRPVVGSGSERSQAAQCQPVTKG